MWGVFKEAFSDIEWNEKLDGEDSLAVMRPNVPFPLFADADYVIHKMVGEVRTPYFIGVKINTNGSHQVIYSKLGEMEGVDQFLATMVRLSGVQ